MFERAIRTLSEWLIAEYRRSYSRKDILIPRETAPTAPATPIITNDGSRKFLNIDELAKYLSIPKSTIYTHVCTGKIPQKIIVRFGRSLRFDINAVNAWIEENRNSRK